MMDTEKAWAILIERKAERKENRTAFLAALIMRRSGDTDTTGVPTLTASEASAYAVELVRIAEALQSLAIAYCNYGLNAGQEKRQETLETRFKALAEALGFRPECSGDPRGHVCKLFDPVNDRAGDGWSGGWGVFR